MSDIQNQSAVDAVASAREWLEGIELGEGMHHRNLTVFPLLARGAGDVEAGSGGSGRYRLLSDAIEAGEAVVEEVSEGGSVPLLAVLNKANESILVPEGEILVGGKQNRVVNLTVLVAVGKRFEVPVSCVEQGRWSYASRQAKAEAYAHPRLRRSHVGAGLRARPGGA